MLNCDVIDQKLKPSVRTWRSRLRGYLARRSRQFLRLMLIVLIALLFMAGLLEAWRGASLIGLPDIGDPFDVAQFRAFRVPPENDAFVLLRQAQQKLTDFPRLPLEVRKLGPMSWSKSAPEVREWVDANREALAMFRAASERPDGIALEDPGSDDGDDEMKLGLFVVQLIRLEASRLEEFGDMAGAWSWYLAVFRVQNHLIRRGSMFQRETAARYFARLQARVAAWAADRRTGTALLRRALADVKALEIKPDGDSFSLKVDYLVLSRELDREWGFVQHGSGEDQQVSIFGERLPPNMTWPAYAARRYFRNEPERSRRVLKLAFANWLSHAADRDPGRQKPAVRATFQVAREQGAASFYPLPVDAPAAARKLPPQDLAQWLAGTLDAKVLLLAWPWPSIPGSERREYRNLVVLLASELFEREQGSPPPSEEALVGRYLDKLPSDGSEELDDGKAPTVRDSHVGN
jgi:hypothetical protein